MRTGSGRGVSHASVMMTASLGKTRAAWPCPVLSPSGLPALLGHATSAVQPALKYGTLGCAVPRSLAAANGGGTEREPRCILQCDGDADAASVRLGLRSRRRAVRTRAVRRPDAGASGSDVGGRPSARIRAISGHRSLDGLPRARARLARMARAHPLREP